MKSPLTFLQPAAVSRCLVRGTAVLLFAGGLASLRAEDPAAPAESAATKAAPLRAQDLECWEKGTLLVSGGWENSGYGVDWSLTVVEVLGPEEVEGTPATAYRFRTVYGLEMSDYLRLRTMDDAKFLKDFNRRHQPDEDTEYKFWQREKDGAVVYWDDDEVDERFGKADVMIPADLSVGSKFNSFGSDTVIGARDEALKGPWGVCEAVRMDTSHPEEVEDDEVYPAHRVESWIGRGLSTVSTRTWHANDVDDEADADDEEPAETLVSEIRLLRVIRPVAEPKSGGQ